MEKLGPAEKFYLMLMKVPFYSLRLEGMILKGDFNSQMGVIRPNLQALSSACRKLIDNKSVKKFLRYVLHAGNFINKVHLTG